MVAKFSVGLTDEYVQKLEKMGDGFESTAEKAIKVAAEIVCDKIRKNLSGVLSGHSSGQLERALGITPVLRDREGNLNAKVGFNEPRVDRKGRSVYGKKLKSRRVAEYELTNAMVANIIEYGKKGQPARPFVKPGTRASKSRALLEMQAVIEREIKEKMK